MEAEAAPFRRRVKGLRNLGILITGIGPNNARRFIAAYLEGKNSPRLLLSCGYAGGLSPRFAVGDLLFDAEPDFELAEKLLVLGARPARFFCSERMLILAEEKKRAFLAQGADAVEMESGVLREACRKAKIPSATIRVVSDRADEDLPLDFNRLSKADSSVNPAKVAAAALRKPRSLPKLMKLHRQSKRAAAILGEALFSLLS